MVATNNIYIDCAVCGPLYKTIIPKISKRLIQHTLRFHTVIHLSKLADFHSSIPVVCKHKYCDTPSDVIYSLSLILHQRYSTEQNDFKKQQMQRLSCVDQVPSMWEIEDDLFSSDHGVGDIFSRNERYPPETYIADSMMGPIHGTFPDEEVDEFKEGMPSLHYTGPPDLHIDPLDVGKFLSTSETCENDKDGRKQLSAGELISENAVQKISKDNLLICPTCSRGFGSIQNLNRHIKRTHERVEELQQGKVFPCDVCNHVYTSEKRLQTHLYNVHYGKNTYQCKLCPSFFKKSGGLLHHMREEHGSKRDRPKNKNEEIYKCIFCSFTSNIKGNVFRHVAGRHGVDVEREKGPFRCDGCTKLYKRRHAFLKHKEACSSLR